MKYKTDLEQTLDRLTRLYSGKAKDEIFAKANVPSEAIRQYAARHPETHCEYPDMVEREQFWDAYLKERTDILDDSIPAAYLSEFDEGLYTAIVGGKIHFMNNTDWGWVSSMGVPCIDRAEDMLALRLDTESEWAQIYLRQLRYFAEKSRGKYGVSHFILIDGLNFILELRGGTNRYYDMLDHPDIVEQVFKLAREVNFWVQDTYFEVCGLFRGGTVSNQCQWVPGRIVSESLDPFHMTSVEDFERWGEENVETVFAHYDGGVFHIHSNGHHLIEHAVRLKGVKSINLLDENHNPVKNYMILDKLDKLRGDIPVHVEMPYELMLQKLRAHELPGNMFFNVNGVPDIDAANRLMEQVRSYRA